MERYNNFIQKANRTFGERSGRYRYIAGNNDENTVQIMSLGAVWCKSDIGMLIDELPEEANFYVQDARNIISWITPKRED